MTTFRIYGKDKGQRAFKALDLGKGRQVNNLIYATILDADEAVSVLNILKEENPEMQFKIKEIK